MTKSYCITIDTEPDCDVKWKRSDPLTFEPVFAVFPQILRPFVRTKFEQKLYLQRLEGIIRYLSNADFQSKTLSAVYEDLS